MDRKHHESRRCVVMEMKRSACRASFPWLCSLGAWRELAEVTIIVAGVWPDENDK